MKSFSKIISLMCVLSFFILALAFPVNAAQMCVGAVNPADYISEVIYDGEDKTVVYDFSDIPWYIVYECTEGEIYEDGLGYWEGPINGLANGGNIMAYPLGWSDYFPAPDDTLFIGDISPGADINYSYDLYFMIDFVNWDDYPSIDVRLYERTYMWDEELNYIGYIEGHSHEFYDGSVEGHMYVPGEQDWITVTGVFPSYATYVRPVVYCDFSLSWDVSITEEHQTFLTIDGSGFELSVDIAAVKSGTALQTAINNKLDLIGGQLDDIGDKLDSIDGALNADGDIDPDVSDFSGAADDINNAMQSAGAAMNAGSGSVSDIVNSSAMSGTITSLASGLSVAFSDEFQINLCGMSFNPFSLWVTVIGGFSLIALTVAYLFRKRGA